jgi:rare lipoprotein A (peptidoglycan hydrolase)
MDGRYITYHTRLGRIWLGICILATVTIGCASSANTTRAEDPSDHLVNDYSTPGDGRVGPDGDRHRLRGEASWYGAKFDGRQTASGEIYDMQQFTAAHKTLPFHTVVRVTDLRNLKSVVVRINDRGPYVDGRIIDLSKAAAREIGLTIHGVRPVRLEILRWGDGTTLHASR